MTTAPPVPALSRRLPLGLVLGATAVNVLGSAVTVVAVPLIVLRLSGTAFQLGLIGACGAIGMVLGNTFGGVLADRLGPRGTAMAGSAAAGAVLASVPLLSGLGVLDVWTLCAVSLLANGAGSAGGMSRRRMVVHAAEDAAVSPDRAEAGYQFLLTAGYIAGIGLAGLLVAAVDLPTLVWLDVASFAVTVVLLAAVRGGAAAEGGVGAGGGAAGGLARDWLDGLRTAWADRDLRLMLTAGCGLSAIGMAAGAVVLPLYAQGGNVPPGGLGWLLAAQTAGDLVGAGLYTVFVTRLAPWATMGASLGVQGAAMLAFAAAPGFPAKLVALGVAGLAAGPMLPLVMAAVRRLAPVEMHGRVLGLFFAATMALGPLSNVVVGGVLEVAPLWTVPALDGVLLAGAAVPLAVRLRRALGRGGVTAG